MTDRSFVSVITPFYNTAEYLEECITSVLRQSHQNFEYLLCDNCSTDGSTEIAQGFAARDSRIRFLRFEQFLPQLENFNRAITHASRTSGWIKLVLADDWIYEQCLRRMLEVGNLDPQIGLVAAYYLMGNAVHGCGLPIDGRVFDGKEACRYQLRDGIFFMGSPSSVMYRGSVVRERTPFYVPDHYHADTEACYDILERYKLGFVHEQLSFLRLGNSSHGTKIASFNFQILDKLIVLDRFATRFLPVAEARTRMRKAKRRYFMFLGASVFRLRESEFWEYHKRGLETIGWQWSRWRILYGGVLVVLNTILNPLSTLQRIWHSLRNRFTQPA